jgi:hypothetical protein
MPTDLDRWLGTEFTQANTELEQAYFAARATIVHDVTDLDQRRRAIRDDGAALVARLGPDISYELLGAVGIYLAACARHEIDVPEPAQAVAGRMGLALGVAPRMVFAHLSTHNPAGHTFTRLPDEHTFTTRNALGVLAYRRAANALRNVAGTPLDGPLATHLLDEAHRALTDVLDINRALAAELDVDRFFRNVRPYFTSHVVCGTVYRGANAGDYSAVGEIDLGLGLCDERDPFYQRILAEKYPYLPPEDQLRLRTPPPNLLARLEPGGPNVERFLAVCRAHGAAYAFHHHRLVKPFLEAPAATIPPDRLATVTASGPPLDVVLATLARLVDLRAARDRPGTAHSALARLRRQPDSQPGSQPNRLSTR